MELREVLDRLNYIRYEVRKESDDAAFTWMGALCDDIERELANPVPGEPPVDEPGAPDLLASMRGGFTAPYHWDGDYNAIDVYLPRGKGTLLVLPMPAYIEVFTFPTPGDIGYMLQARCEDGLYRSFGHVGTQYRSGPTPAYTPFGVLGDSGFATLRQWKPEHIHYTVSATGGVQSGLRGDRPAINDWVALYGHDIEIVEQIPGPADYQAGLWYAGRRR